MNLKGIEPFYQEIFLKYSKEKFPFTLLDRFGYRRFENVEELRKFYVYITKRDKILKNKTIDQTEKWVKKNDPSRRNKK